MRRIENLHICVGLPFCGKSTWIAQQKSLLEKDLTMLQMEKCRFFDLKSKMVNPENEIRNTEEAMAVSMNYIGNGKIVYIEGYFFNIDDVSKYLDVMVNHYDYYVHNLIIDFWPADRTLCDYNSDGLASSMQKHTIFYKTVETDGASDLLEKFGLGTVKVENHKAEIKPKWAYFAAINKIKLYKERYLVSQRWVIGGSENDDGEITVIQPDIPQKQFDEFDNLVLSHFPDIPASEFIKLKNSCCALLVEDENEFFGSSRSYMRYSCDMEIFYGFLKKLEELEVGSKLCDVSVESSDDGFEANIKVKGSSMPDILFKIGNIQKKLKE